ncbi:Hypothetical predicted protein [Paramuricea clavata]|uniref:Uncharacterized protein n=1 Tax=Paramuricea clavata TaxID=317549 RepID=A0A6S7HYH4_PARCT|nr:Hypothetical predicted protein [Paramuricea clavata]
MPPKGYKSSKRKVVEISGQSITVTATLCKPTIASPSAGPTTSSTVHEPVNVTSTSAAPDASTISPQLLQQIVSTVTAEVTWRLTPHHQAEFSDAVVEAPVVAMGSIHLDRTTRHCFWYCGRSFTVCPFRHCR